jgi:hypothetical protein
MSFICAAHLVTYIRSHGKRLWSSLHAANVRLFQHLKLNEPKQPNENRAIVKRTRVLEERAASSEGVGVISLLFSNSDFLCDNRNPRL